MKIFYLLSGPGTKEGFSEEIKRHMKNDFKDKTEITFITSTPNNYTKNDLYIYGNNDSITGMVNHMKEIMNLKKVNVIDKRIEPKKGKEIILNSEIVYLMGGNTFEQLEYLKESHYDEILKKYNGILLGTSCGAMNIANQGYYSKDDDYEKSFFYDGINLIDITIDPHFDVNNKEQEKEIKQYSKTREIIGLPNESAIRIENDKITYINNVYIYDNRGKNDN